jgi:hypothetical protein
MPRLTAKKNDARFKVAVVAIIVILAGGLGATLGMFAGDLIAASIFASTDGPVDGQTIGGTIGFALAVWFVVVAAKRI